jgi:hypothetical protein
MPEVLAPVHHPVGTAENPLLQAGTSFATPIVSGFLTSIVGDLLELGIRPGPADLYTASESSTTAIDEGGVGKFQAGRTWDTLRTRLD